MILELCNIYAFSSVRLAKRQTSCVGGRSRIYLGTNGRTGALPGFMMWDEFHRVQFDLVLFDQFSLP